jgi:hypothetical protein
MTWHTIAWAGAGLLASAIGACTNPYEPVAKGPASIQPETRAQSVTLSSPPAASPPVTKAAAARKYMLTHFAQSEDMRRAMIGGDLTALHSAAEGVAKDEWTPNSRADWRPHVLAIRSAARAAQTALSLESAASAFADLGMACASCHRITGGPGSVRFPTPLAGGAGLMVAHESATERLWHGLVAPSDAAWLEGADELIAAPELASDVKEIATRADRVRDLARRSKTVAAGDRARLLGDLLLTCANCHQQVGVRPFVAQSE